MSKPCGTSIHVVAETIDVDDGKLNGNKLQHTSRHLCWVGQKCALESRGSELQREAQAVVITTAISDERAIRIVEVKVARQLSFIQLTFKTPVLATLRVGYEFSGHFILACAGTDRGVRVYEPDE